MGALVSLYFGTQYLGLSFINLALTSAISAWVEDETGSGAQIEWLVHNVLMLYIVWMAWAGLRKNDRLYDESWRKRAKYVTVGSLLNQMISGSQLENASRDYESLTAYLDGSMFVWYLMSYICTFFHWYPMLMVWYQLFRSEPLTVDELE